MNVIEFVTKFIDKESNIRLLFEKPWGHKTVIANFITVSNANDIINKGGIYSDFLNYDVKHIITIADLPSNYYPDAINIVIEEPKPKKYKLLKLFLSTR